MAEEDQQRDDRGAGEAPEDRDQVRTVAPADEPHVPVPPWEAELDEYPTRGEGESDPRWALVLFWIWAIFTVLALLFMATLIGLGFVYD
jgi:hypothetical protein